MSPTRRMLLRSVAATAAAAALPAPIAEAAPSRYGIQPLNLDPETRTDRPEIAWMATAALIVNDDLHRFHNRELIITGYRDGSGRIAFAAINDTKRFIRGEPGIFPEARFVATRFSPEQFAGIWLGMMANTVDEPAYVGDWEETPALRERRARWALEGDEDESESAA